MGREEKRRLWRERMVDYEASGEGIRSWCKRKGFSRSTFNYWRYTVRIQNDGKLDGIGTASPVGWVEVTPAVETDSKAKIFINVNGAAIEVLHGFDHALLREVVQALS